MFPRLLPEQTHCRYIPGDPDWPTADAWNMLHATVSGQPLKTVPLAQVTTPSLTR